MTDLFDEDESELIRKGRELLTLVTTLSEQAKTDHTKQPTPTMLGLMMNPPMSADDVTQLLDFAMNDLGSFEADRLFERASEFLNPDGSTILNPQWQ